MADAAACYEGNDALLPDLVLAVYDTLFQFVRTHAIYAFHQDITKYGTVNDTLDQRQCQFKAGLLSSPLKLREITGICSIPAFFRARRMNAI